MKCLLSHLEDMNFKPENILPIYLEAYTSSGIMYSAYHVSRNNWEFRVKHVTNGVYVFGCENMIYYERKIFEKNEFTKENYISNVWRKWFEHQNLIESFYYTQQEIDND